MSGPGQDDGFTLIEVLVAMVVFSVSILGLMGATTQATRTASAVELKTLAGIVADNQLALNAARPRGESVQMGREFEWTYQLVDTPEPRLKEHLVTVSHEGRVILTRRTYRAGYVTTTR